VSASDSPRRDWLGAIELFPPRARDRPAELFFGIALEFDNCREATGTAHTIAISIKESLALVKLHYSLRKVRDQIAATATISHHMISQPFTIATPLTTNEWRPELLPLY
jgi:hypothetical protein